MADGNQATAETKAKKPILNLQFLSHGTLESTDLEASRRFYEDFLGLDVVRTSPVSLMIRLGGDHVYAVVQTKKKDLMPRRNHNGLDVATDEDVDETFRLVNEHAEEFGIHTISPPRHRHGTYSFFFYDLDDNAWEILSNPKGGYSWLYTEGDQEGLGHMDKEFRHRAKAAD